MYISGETERNKESEKEGKGGKLGRKKKGERRKICINRCTAIQICRCTAIKYVCQDVQLSKYLFKDVQLSKYLFTDVNLSKYVSVYVYSCLNVYMQMYSCLNM